MDMLAPLFRSNPSRFNRLDTPFFHFGDQFGNPVNLHLGKWRLVCQRSGYLRSVNEEEIWRIRDHHSEVRKGAIFPFLAQGNLVSALDGEIELAACDCVIASCENNHVQVVVVLIVARNVAGYDAVGVKSSIIS